MKNFEISIYLQLLYVAMTWQSNVHVPDGDQSSSLLGISNSFLFNIGIVHHFDMVNHLDTVETGLQAHVHVHQPPRCQVRPVSYGQQIVADSYHGVWQGWGTRVDLQLESIITQPALIGCRYPL